MAENSKTSLGVITQIVGAVLDIRFQDGNLPEINEAIHILSLIHISEPTRP